MKCLPSLWVAALVPLAAGMKVSAMPPRPSNQNVIFILADDLGYMDVGCYNPKTFYETPNIDRLAKEGMRFTSGYAACPVCSPTRASILTGKYPVRTGITNYIGGNRAGKLPPAPNADHLALEEITLAEAFRAAGYKTFFAGKWHLGGEAFSPQAQGFDVVPHLQPSTDDPKTSDQIATECIRFIEANRDGPFFAYLAFHAVHIPIKARQSLVEKYEKKAQSAPATEWGTERGSKVRLTQNHAGYAAMVEQMDAAIGRVLDAVERNGIDDKTVVVFMSDNGGLATAEGHPTSNLPLRAGKGWLYEGGVREPWIIKAYGYVKTGGVCDEPVTSTDFYPTLLEICGLPALPKQHVDGQSLIPLLAGRAMKRGPIYWHYPHYGNQGGAPAGAIRDGDWKLIEWYEDGRLELYNLRDDIGETKNLVQANPAKAKELHDKLVAWRKETNAVMPTPVKGDK